MSPEFTFDGHSAPHPRTQITLSGHSEQNSAFRRPRALCWIYPRTYSVGCGARATGSRSGGPGEGTACDRSHRMGPTGTAPTVQPPRAPTVRAAAPRAPRARHEGKDWVRCGDLPGRGGPFGAERTRSPPASYRSGPPKASVRQASARSTGTGDHPPVRPSALRTLIAGGHGKAPRPAHGRHAYVAHHQWRANHRGKFRMTRNRFPGCSVCAQPMRTRGEVPILNSDAPSPRQNANAGHRRTSRSRDLQQTSHRHGRRVAGLHFAATGPHSATNCRIS